MELTLSVLSWVCQIYLAYLFFRSAYRKTMGFDRVSAEFKGWGYPFPRQITRFLIAVWLVNGTALVIPGWAVFAAVVLLAFMLVAFATLVVHREYRRTVEPARPIALLVVVIAIRHAELLDSIAPFFG